ncbi:MAG: carbohydrate kinase family protein [Clostridia bacterium]|nr:carbohydrate kinase family protein [Clostridia bacterium]
MRITVVGGMNLDILGAPAEKMLPRDSTPGFITLRPGGVGRNIAARLSQKGAQVSLITALGNDERASMLIAFCRQAGLDLSHSIQTDCPAPCYLCIHDEKGDMAQAINDMRAMAAITPEAMESRMDDINQGDGCVLDANLSPETLRYIAENARVPLFLDPVSCAKAPRILPILPHLTAIKPNLMEAEALTGEKEPEKAARALVKAGVKHVFISMGEKGVCFANAHEAGQVAAIPLPHIPLTGAGDALCAGVTLALLEGKSTGDSATQGCLASYEALMAAR